MDSAENNACSKSKSLFTNKFLLLFCCVISLCGTAQAQTRIACIGNSITYGYGLASPATKSYPPRLQALLGRVNDTVQNEGVSSTTLQKKGDYSYWKYGKLAQVFAFQPKIVTIKLGTNDSKPPNWDSLGYGTQFKTDYLALVDTLAAMASKPRIYLVLPVPVFSNIQATNWGIRDSAVRKIIVIVKGVAALRSLTVIDCNTPLKNFPQYFATDGVHPDTAGEDTIAHVIYRALTATSVANREPGNATAGESFTFANNGNSVDFTLPQSGVKLIEIIGLQGKVLFSATTNGNSFTWDKSGSGGRNIMPGVYIARVFGNGISAERKMVIER